jgi:hypothetical protein
LAINKAFDKKFFFGIFHIDKTLQLQLQPITGKNSDQHSRASSLSQTNSGVIVISQAEVLVR